MKKVLHRLVIIILLCTFLSHSISASASEAKQDNTIQGVDVDENKIEIMSSLSDPIIDLTPKYDKTSGLYGYVNKKGKWIIDPIFYDARPFSQGLAAAAEDVAASKYGYINAEGTFVIKPQYMSADAFDNDFALVLDNDFHILIINKKGEVIKKTNYYSGSLGVDGLREVIADKPTSQGYENIKYGAITMDGKIVKPQYDGVTNKDAFICFFHNSASTDYYDRKYYYLTPKATVVELPGDIIRVSENIGLIEYKTKDEDYRYAYITKNGKIIKSYKDYEFLEAKDFSEGFGLVKINIGETEGQSESSNFDRYGFLKKDGTWLVEPMYLAADSFHNGAAPVKIVSWSYIKSDLTEFIEEYEPSEEEIKARNDFNTNEAKKILKEIIDNSMSDYEKVYKIYEYITKTVRYDRENYDNNNVPRASTTIYGTLNYHMAVCSGYAGTIKFMMDLAGIECKIVGGSVNGSGAGHEWNMVKINGSYYNLDATWDEDKGPNDWDYFLKSDEVFAKSRVWDRQYYPKAPKNYK